MEIRASQCLGAILALLFGLGWIAVCQSMDWSLCSYGGIIVGGVVGLGCCLGNRAVPSFFYAVAASVLTLVLLLAANDFLSRQQKTEALEEIQSEESYILAVAEQILLQRFVQGKKTSDVQQTNGPAPGVAFLTTRDEIPHDVWNEATTRWNALREQDKNLLRKQRLSRIEASHGKNLEHFDDKAPWFTTLVVYTLATGATFLLAAIPAISEFMRYSNGY